MCSNPYERFMSLTQRKRECLRQLIRHLPPTTPHASREGDVSEWISVKERMPDHRGDVLVYTGNGVGISWRSPVSGWNGCYLPSRDPRESMEDELIAASITHWMPLPTPPSES